jgi:hypothetical protein
VDGPNGPKHVGVLKYIINIRKVRLSEAVIYILMKMHGKHSIKEEYRRLLGWHCKNLIGGSILTYIDVTRLAKSHYLKWAPTLRERHQITLVGMKPCYTFLHISVTDF